MNGKKIRLFVDMLDSSVTTCGIAVDYDGDGCSMWVMILS